MTLKQELAKAYGLLEKMEIQAKRSNVYAVSYALYVLEKAYDSIKDDVKEEGNEDGGH